VTSPGLLQIWGLILRPATLPSYCSRRRQRESSDEQRRRTRPKSATAAAAVANGGVALPAGQAAQQGPAGAQQGGHGSGAVRDSGAGRDSANGQDAYIDFRGRKRRRLRAPPLPDAHLAPDGRKLSQLSRAEAQALLEVRLPNMFNLMQSQ
jgi:hypothetical protein